MHIAYLLVVFFGVSTSSLAQQQKWPLQITAFNNATLLPPGILTRIFQEPPHPGLSVGTTYTHLHKGPHEWLQTAKAGYFYHRYSQHAIQVYTETGYRYHAKGGLDFGPFIGGGYLHSIPDLQTFRRNNQGAYERQRNLGRPQAMFSTSLEFGYTTTALTNSPLRFMLAYQFWVQSPFVRQYVPVLPHTALHMGLSIPLR